VQGWIRRFSPAIFFGFIAITILAPIATNQTLLTMVDYLNHLSAIVQAKMALNEGQFPLRVMPLENSGWRYPFFQFTSPTTYTFAALIYKWLTPQNPITAFIITIWCGATLGGLYLYRLAYWFTQSRVASLLAGVVYLYAPYYIILVNHLGNLNESVAMGLIPVVVYYNLQRFYQPNNNAALAKVAVAWYFLITVHTVTFIYTSLFTALLLIFITIKNRRRWINLFRVGIGYIFGCLLAMWFIAPLAAIANYFVFNVTYNDPANLLIYHPTLSQLLSPAANLISGNRISALFTVHPSLGWPILFGVITCFYCFVNKFSSGNKRADYWLPALLVLFVLAFLLVWSPVNFWRFFPQPLLSAQYCWRLLNQVTWIGALLFAWSICWIFKNKLDVRHLIIGTFLIGCSMASWFPTLEAFKGPLAELISKPYQYYNQNAYTINFNAHTNFVDSIDSVLLNPDKSLRLEREYLIAPSLVAIANKPVVLVYFDSLPTKVTHELSAEIDNQPVNNHQLNTSNLIWNIPVTNSNKQNEDPYKLNIKTKRPVSEPIKVNKMLLAGFLPKESFMDISQVSPFCHQKGDAIRCKLEVKSGVNLIELPSLFYPSMLSITLNNKPITYNSIVYQGNLLTSITPITGTNEITVRFVGISWANWVSIGAWGLLLLLLLQSKYRMLRIK